MYIYLYRNQMKKFFRKCPLCTKHIQYKTYKTYWVGKKHNYCCKSCSKKDNRHPFFGKQLSITHRNNIRKSQIGKKHSEDTKAKIRTSYINRIIKQNILVAYNPKACEFIDKLNKQKGWGLQHALNGGEVQLYGYFVDGYDKERNIIFEYDEKRHEFEDKKSKDLKRTHHLINKLNCSVIRYSEKFDVLYKSLPYHSERLRCSKV
jgi:NUMOD3 motif